MLTPERKPPDKRRKKIYLELAHARLEHIDRKRIFEMVKSEAIIGMNINVNQASKYERCRVCVEANMKIANFPKKGTKELVKMDVLGMDLKDVGTVSHAGYKYLSIYPEYETGFLATAPLKTKGGHQKIAGSVIEWIESIAEKKLKAVRADQGGEFIDEKFKEELKLSDMKMAFHKGLAEVYERKLF